MKPAVVPLVCLVLIGGTQGHVRADPSAAAQFETWAIRATTKNQEISRELQPIADQLKKQFKFTGFKLEKRVTGSGELNQPFRAELVQGYRTELTLLESRQNRMKFDVGLFQRNRPVVRTTVTVDAGRFQLLGGPKIDGDDTLIVAVTAR